MYELSSHGKLRKKRLRIEPEQQLDEFADDGIPLPLETTRGVVGWIILFGSPIEVKGERAMELGAAELAQWLTQLFKYREARRLAVKDGLTDLFNYRFFIDALEGEIKRAKKFCSLIVMDVDDFKKYNDHFGHLRGSALLTEVAAILRRSSGSGNLVAKYGGDEFAVILPEVSKEEAFLLAQGIRYRIERYKFHGEEESQPNQILTVSGGVATYPIDAKDAFTLFDQADRAMYDAKRRGKNRIMYLD